MVLPSLGIEDCGHSHVSETTNADGNIAYASPESVSHPAPVSGPSPAHSGISQLCVSTGSTRDAWATPDQSPLVIDDLALMHHWTYSTSIRMINCPQFDHYWQVVFPQIGLCHPFVMHGILGLAGLHLALVNHEQRSHFLLVSAKHYGEALRGYREGIQHMSDKNSDALFTFSILNMLYVMAKNGPAFRGDDEDVSIPRRSRIPGFDWISMMRGVEAVLQPVHDHVRLGPLRPLLGVEGFDAIDPDYEKAPGDEHFHRLRELWAGGTDAEVYDSTLHLLRKSHAFMMRASTPGPAVSSDLGYNDRAWSTPMIWLHYAPEKYFELLRQHQPVALVLFVFFGALLHSLDELWFLAGWGRSIADSVDEYLGDFWKPWTAWPRSIINSK